MLSVGGVCTVLGAWGFHLDKKEKRKEISATPKIEEKEPELAPYVKIGKVNASFNKALHSCKLPKIGPYEDETKGWEIGTVISCTIPECGQEWVLGYYQETFNERQARIERTNRAYDNRTHSYTRTLHVGNGQFYAEEMNPIIPQEVRRKWYTMEQYEADPDKYVYFT